MPLAYRFRADEPLILFRARDKYALAALIWYHEVCETNGCTDFHISGICNRVEAFRKFKEEHPERMKQPGTARGM
jgi:hypothetical protein